MIEKSKVEKRRESKILEAANQKDWKAVSKLLNQQIENLERNDRRHNLVSLNTQTSLGTSEVIDFIPDNSYNAVKHILLKEQNEHLFNALLKLPKDDLHIFLEMTLNNKSAFQLTKETQYRSHKTIQRHFEKARKFLENDLKNYF